MKPAWRAWYHASIWLAYTLLGILVPVVVGLVVVCATKNRFRLGDLTDGGQFAVYTAAMLAGTFYLVTKPSALRLPYTEWFGWATYIGLASATVLFTLALLSSAGQDINRDFFQWPSIVVSILALGVAFLAVKWDYERMQVEPRAELREEQEDLRKKFRQFDQTEEQGNGS